MKLAKGLVLAALLHSGAASADQAVQTDHDKNAMGSTERFTEDGGAEIYAHVCAGCHMPDAHGAIGAGAYPALAGDSKLEEAGYPIAMVLHGQKAMPALGGFLSDQQAADVVNFVRGSFRNSYADKVTVEDVKAER